MVQTWNFLDALLSLVPSHRDTFKVLFSLISGPSSHVYSVKRSVSIAHLLAGAASALSYTSGGPNAGLHLSCFLASITWRSSSGGLLIETLSS